MNTQLQHPTLRPTPRAPKKVRHYVMAYRCPRCDTYGYFAGDFVGVEEAVHGCGQSVKVMSPEME